MLILSEGAHHIAVFKPSNICVVGGYGIPKPTLLDLMRKRFGKNVFAVHRLDRGTSGITLFAKSTFAKLAIENAFKKRLVKKTYLAVCEGEANFIKKNIELRLKRIEKSSKNGPVPYQIIDETGEYAQTLVRVIKQIDQRFCLIEARPTTGRMHQIRVHLASLDLPVLGDHLYGSKTKLASEHTLALCAVNLSLPAPKDGVIKIDAHEHFRLEDFLSLA